MSASDLTPVVKQLTQDQIQRYAGASGDHNPIHVDEAFARASPLGGTVAHGMLVLAFLSEMMAASCGAPWLTGGRLRVRFRAPARPGDTVTASGRVQSERDGAVTYAVECRNQADEVLISGTAEVALDG